jgi:hypothetical protein
MDDSIDEKTAEFFRQQKERNPNFQIIEPTHTKSTKRDWLAETMTSREQGDQLKKWLRLLDKEDDI